jgi:hypothetical protein
MHQCARTARAKGRRIGANAADVETRLAGDFAVEFAFGFDHADHVHGLPQGTVRHAMEIAQGAVATGLAAAVTLLDGFDIIRGHVGAVLGVSVNEGLFDLGGQRLLVAFERQHVVTARLSLPKIRPL